MAEDGLDGVAIREVARRLDYSPAALYRYFDGRDQLIAALAAEAAGHLAERLRAVEAASAAERLRGIGLAYLSFADQEPTRFRLLFVELPSSRTTLAEGPPPRSPYAIVVGAARDAIESGGLTDTLDPEVVAYTLWSLVHGMAVLESTHLKGFSGDFDGAHRAALDLLIASWKPAPTGGPGEDADDEHKH
jgi:AcrR family transcriptional regulator